MRTLRFAFVVAGAPLVLFIGCRDPKVSAYKAPKDLAPPAAAFPTADSVAPAIQWKTPAGWEEQPPSEMRKGSFLIAGGQGEKADMSITTFPGTVGGDLANVNRWRDQIRLPPISEADLGKQVRTEDFPAGHFSLLDITSETAVLDGKSKARILGAWLKQKDRTWFFKLSGPANLVGVQSEAFHSLLNSIAFAAPHNSAAAAPSTASEAAGAGAPLTWTAPAQWTAKPLGQMRKGSFAVRGNTGTEADLSIISFPGDAGGLVENLNRWRGQIQLPILPATQIAGSASTLANGPLRFTIVDYLGTAQNVPTRIVGAVLPLENETYFFKLMGPDAVVAQQKNAFLGFLKSVKAP